LEGHSPSVSCEIPGEGSANIPIRTLGSTEQKSHLTGNFRGLRTLEAPVDNFVVFLVKTPQGCDKGLGKDKRALGILSLFGLL
jgi:hypothetical protein